LDINTLIGGLGSIVTSPAGLAERVLDKLQDELAKSGAFDPAAETSEDLIATALGSWIASRFVDGRSAFSDGLEDNNETSADALGDRDQLLAAALGACQCWGHDAECRSCDGAGVTGWRMPDKELFVQYVGPAIAAARGRGIGATGDMNPNPTTRGVNTDD
jgi:hypothetical protein